MKQLFAVGVACNVIALVCCDHSFGMHGYQLMLPSLKYIMHDDCPHDSVTALWLYDLTREPCKKIANFGQPTSLECLCLVVTR